MTLSPEVLRTLTRTERNMYDYLLPKKGQIVSRAELSKAVFDEAAWPKTNIIDVYIHHLRHKTGLKIETIRNQGYRLKETA